MVVADAGVLAEGAEAPPVDRHQLAVAQPQQVRRQPRQLGGPRRLPRLPAVGALGLPQPHGFPLSLAVVADLRHQASVRRLHGVRLVEIAGLLARRQRNRADAPPRARAVARLGDRHLVGRPAEDSEMSGVGDPDIKQPPVFQHDRPVRRGARRAHRRLPALAAIRRADREVAQAVPLGLRRDLLVMQPPVEARRAGLQLGAVADAGRVGQRGEPRCHQVAAGQLHKARVTVVQRRVADVGRRRPSRAAVRAAHHLHLAERTDVLVAIARKHRQQLAVGTGADRRPADVPPRLLAQHPRPHDLRAGLPHRRPADLRRRLLSSCRQHAEHAARHRRPHVLPVSHVAPLLALAPSAPTRPGHPARITHAHP